MIHNSTAVIFYDDAENAPVASWGIPITQGWGYFSGGDHNINNHDQHSTIIRSTDVSRLGASSYKVTITKDLTYTCKSDSRSEVQWLGSGQAITNWEWASMSTYIPSDFCFGSERMSIGFNLKKISSEGSAIFRLEVKNGRYNVEFTNFVGLTKSLDLGPVVTNQWEDWAYHSNFKDDNTGFARFYRDGVLVFSVENAPVYDYEGGSTTRDPYMFQGFYKWVWLTPDGQTEGVPDCNTFHTYYIDELKFGNTDATLEEMSPTSTPSPVRNYVQKVESPFQIVDGISRRVAKITYMNGDIETIPYQMP